MERKRSWKVMLVFFSGMIVGVTLAGLFIINAGCAPGAGSSSPKPVKLSDARSSYKLYLSKSPIVMKDTLKAFTIDRMQFDAMNLLVQSNSTLPGFRIYLGTDPVTSNRVAIVLGTDLNGMDMTTSIYSTEIGKAGPCPPVCDTQSKMN